MRHRAALGLAEATDADVLIVSEQDGQISLAEGSKLEKNLSITEVRARLRALAIP
jgi:diadenylate cyclase